MTESPASSNHNEPLVTLRTFGNEAEAAMAQGVLNSNGIPAYSQGGQTASTFGLTTTSLGGVRLQVPESRLKQAEKILVEQFDELGEVPAWTCPQCRAEVDAGFAVCWQCGRDFSADDAKPQQSAEIDTTFPFDTDDSAPGEDAVEKVYCDEVAERALRMAVLGCFFPPLNLIAYVHMIRCWWQPLSPDGIRKVIGAFLLVKFSSVCWSIFLDWFLPKVL